MTSYEPRFEYNATMSFPGEETSVEHLRRFLQDQPGTYIVRIKTLFGLHETGQNTQISVSEE